DQQCAAELRRARKRGLVPTPRRRIVINHRICEGCGDCGDKSNCLSVQPLDTPFGTKTAIHQASCNFDYSCVEGDCPAFMEVEVVEGDERQLLVPPALDEPPPATISGTVPIRMAGIGGTGVVTAAQVLATAAMFDGWQVAGLDQTGLSQKAGPVVSDVVVADRDITTNLVGQGEAAVLLAFDQLVAASDPVIGVCDPHRTRVVASTERVPTGSMIGHPEVAFPAAEAVGRLQAAAAEVVAVDAAALAEATTGTAAPANIVVLGMACQLGVVPVRPESVRRAIELNGVAVQANLAAFEWGRAAVDAPSRTQAVLEDHRLATGARVTVDDPGPELIRRIDGWRLEADLAAELVRLTGDLVGHQSHRWAARFLDTLEPLVSADPGSELTRQAARSLHKLMAYKDEYEVARLMLLPEATAAVRSAGGKPGRARWLLHPPVLAALGVRRKVRFGSWSRPVFALLRHGKRLRGTWADPFGRPEVRRVERAMIPEFAAALQLLTAGLDRVDYAEAVRIARLPQQVTGYEELKLRRAAVYREELARSLSLLS
ncbi:MAG: DUF6537 domain-containing protein, partial [Acidimicrobiia bacterium]